MAIKIPAPVLWDKELNFLNNALVSCDGLSNVVGTVLKPTRVFPPAATPTLQSCLQITDPTFGTLYLNMTLDAWQAAIRAIGISPGVAPNTLLYSITTTQSTITDPLLDGATILAIWKNGIMIKYGTDVTLAGDTLTFTSDLQNTDTVGVLYIIG